MHRGGKMAVPQGAAVEEEERDEGRGPARRGLNLRLAC